MFRQVFPNLLLLTLNMPLRPSHFKTSNLFSWLSRSRTVLAREWIFVLTSYLYSFCKWNQMFIRNWDLDNMDALNFPLNCRFCRLFWFEWVHYSKREHLKPLPVTNNSVSSRTYAASHVGHNSCAHVIRSSSSRTDAVICNWKGLAGFRQLGFVLNQD